MDAAQRRGWAVVNGDELHGMIFFYGGDDSEFVANKKGWVKEGETMSNLVKSGNSSETRT